MKRKPKAGSGGSSRQQDDEDEFELDDAELTKITGMVTDAANAAVTAQIGRKLGPALAAALPAALKPIQDQLAQLIPAGGGQQQQPGAGGAPAGGQQPGAGGQQQQPGTGAPAGGGQVSPEMAAMQRELAELKAQAAKRDTDLKAAAQREREGKRDAMLADHLGKVGVDKNRVRGATAVLRDQMVWEDGADNGKGGWVYRAQRDGYHEDLDVAKGVAEWSGTDEGKSYIAPQQGRGGGPNFGGAGSGARPGQGQRIGGAPPAGANPKQERVRQAEAALGPLVADMLGGGSISITGGGS